MINQFELSAYDFGIPEELIAQEPFFPRDACRLLVMNRAKASLKETVFKNIAEFLRADDILVINDTSVIKARLFANRASGAKIEVLLVRELSSRIWLALVKPGRRARFGDVLNFDNGVSAKVVEHGVEGQRKLEFSCDDILSFLAQYGKTPLPSYIKKEVSQHEHYQTIYAKNEGAVAAPTAGFHFTDELFSILKNKGVSTVKITLHCGPATFRPVKAHDVRNHIMDTELVKISQQSATAINAAKQNGGRIIAVGTTAMRSLESAASDDGVIAPFAGPTDIYIYPGYRFKAVDALITNFHTPHSSNLILISAFAGYGFVKKAYQFAAQEKFRFYSFGDATFII